MNEKEKEFMEDLVFILSKHNVKIEQLPQEDGEQGWEYAFVGEDIEILIEEGQYQA